MERLSLHIRLQHMVLFSSCILLIVTGLPIKFHDAAISAFLIDIMGGPSVTRILHRIGAIALTFIGVYHIYYCMVFEEGRKTFGLLIPKPQDAKDALHQIGYFLGIKKDRPLYGRFSYIEKFDYWAVYWGMVVMITSGYILWFKDWPSTSSGSTSSTSGARPTPTRPSSPPWPSSSGTSTTCISTPTSSREPHLVERQDHRGGVQGGASARVRGVEGRPQERGCLVTPKSKRWTLLASRRRAGPLHRRMGLRGRDGQAVLLLHQVPLHGALRGGVEGLEAQRGRMREVPPHPAPRHAGPVSQVQHGDLQPPARGPMSPTPRASPPAATPGCSRASPSSS